MFKNSLLLSMVLIVPSVFADNSADAKALKKDMPQDVVQIIDRTLACNRWGGEEPTKKEQIERVNQELERWRCDAIEVDQAQLAKRYQNNYDIKSRVQKAKDIY